jgi:hypothetical protein
MPLINCPVDNFRHEPACGAAYTMDESCKETVRDHTDVRASVSISNPPLKQGGHAVNKLSSGQF